jgi:hypothetical protein
MGGRSFMPGSQGQGKEMGVDEDVKRVLCN